MGRDHVSDDGGDISQDVADAVDRQRLAARAWDNLALLDERHRKVAWDYIALGRPRAEIAAELDVSPARVSQMATRALEILLAAMMQDEVK